MSPLQRVALPALVPLLANMNPQLSLNCWRQIKISRVLESHYCKLVFFISLGVSYLLVPAMALKSDSQLWVVSFMILFAASLTCSVRSIKDRLSAGIKQKTSFLSLLAGLIGLTAVQFCSVNAVMCASTVGFGLAAAILPSGVFHFFKFNAVSLLIASSFIQLIALLQMGCFKKQDCDSL